MVIIGKLYIHFYVTVSSEVHHLQVKISELSSEVDSLREEKTQYQNKAAELVG